MEKQEQEESASSLPVLPRIDRLDRLLQLLEEKHSLSGRHFPKTAVQKAEEQEEDQCKALSSALDEVQHKGTLMERLAMLENRVLQLSLDMDKENTSKSSSSTAQGIESPLSVRDQDNTKTSHVEKKGHTNSRRQSKKAHKKWWGWLRMGC